MPELEALRYAGDVLHVLDQTRLPGDEVWIALRTSAQIRDAIHELRVRGAPMIGIVAAYGIAVIANRGEEDVAAAAATIRAARPTAVNLMHAVDAAVGAGALEKAAIEWHESEIAACHSMGRNGASLLGSDVRLMTVCNTGALATGGIGTAIGVIRTAHDDGKLAQAWVPETRPLLQGSRLTAWELGRLGVPYRLIADAATGQTFSRGFVDAVVVGADRVAANGDTANKIGTYTLAVLAARHGVPFYVVAPTTTIDPLTPDGSSIPIEERDADEVRRVRGELLVAPADASCANPAFDVTPAELITGIVTERGIDRPPYRYTSAGIAATDHRST